MPTNSTSPGWMRTVLSLAPEDLVKMEDVQDQNPIPVKEMGPKFMGIPLSIDVAWKIAFEGRVFGAADGDQNDTVTGQTSFANTTPTFLLDNPSTSGVLCIPSYFWLNQTGSVAGGDITISIEKVAPSAYASSGTSEKVQSLGTGMPAPPTKQCRLFSNPTATAGYGLAVGGLTVAPDVSPAEAIINIFEFSSPTGLWLWPGSSLNIFTVAASTGPTWNWNVVWTEIPLVGGGWFS